MNRLPSWPQPACAGAAENARVPAPTTPAALPMLLLFSALTLGACGGIADATPQLVASDACETLCGALDRCPEPGSSAADCLQACPPIVEQAVDAGCEHAAEVELRCLIDANICAAGNLTCSGPTSERIACVESSSSSPPPPPKKTPDDVPALCAAVCNTAAACDPPQSTPGCINNCESGYLEAEALNCGSHYALILECTKNTDLCSPIAGGCEEESELYIDCLLDEAP